MSEDDKYGTNYILIGLIGCLYELGRKNVLVKHLLLLRILSNLHFKNTVLFYKHCVKIIKHELL